MTVLDGGTSRTSLVADVRAMICVYPSLFAALARRARFADGALDGLGAPVPSHRGHLEARILCQLLQRALGSASQHCVGVDAAQHRSAALVLQKGAHKHYRSCLACLVQALCKAEAGSRLKALARPRYCHVIDGHPHHCHVVDGHPHHCHVVDGHPHHCHVVDGHPHHCHVVDGRVSYVLAKPVRHWHASSVCACGGAVLLGGHAYMREREQSLLIGQTHAGPLLKTLSVSLAMSLAFSVSAL